MFLPQCLPVNQCGSREDLYKPPCATVRGCMNQGAMQLWAAPSCRRRLLCRQSTSKVGIPTRQNGQLPVQIRRAHLESSLAGSQSRKRGRNADRWFAFPTSLTICACRSLARECGQRWGNLKCGEEAEEDYERTGNQDKAN